MSDNSPIGTKKVGYSGPQDGPFMCSNCVHFKRPDDCTHPEVIADPQVEKEREADGSIVAEVDPYGCCFYFRSARRVQETKFDDAFPEESGSYSSK